VKKDLKQAFGQVIRELRDAKGLSQQEVADYSEMDRTYLSDLERGLHMPTLNIVFKLADVFKVKPQDLVQKVDKAMQ
jgi:transcriptional regulator with XRE-family HTH domain